MVDAVIRHTVEMVCILEASARKPGNVYPGADLPTLTFAALGTAATAIGPELADDVPLGQRVLRAVRVTQQMVGTNANLGIILLLAPLCCVPVGLPLTDAAVAEVLQSLTPQDTADVYQAIREANPGGLGKADSMDVADAPPQSLVAAMAAAADRDLVARQYANNFQDIREIGLSAFQHSDLTLEERIVWCHLQFLAHFPDSHIQRRQGPEAASQVMRRVQDVVKTLLALSETPPAGLVEHEAVVELDRWLRSPLADGRTMNPGTTADLVTATLYWAFRTRLVNLRLPFRRSSTNVTS